MPGDLVSRESVARKLLPAGRWARVEEIFFAAAELPPDAQNVFVIAQCGGDTQLRDDVLSLLDYDTREQMPSIASGLPPLLDAIHAGAHSVLGRDATREAEAGEGRIVGPYRLSRELGRGGMSVVWLASRADGEFRKDVAIKLIKRGMDTDSVIRRLRRERRILAALDHPYIARLLDGSTTADGLPWIAMEYVEGMPIVRYSETHTLGIDERCRLVSKICEAAGYAHRNLVVHRDLKPANILVDSSGNPKLLDFGIAGLLSTAGESPESDGIPGGPLTSDAPLTRGFARPLTPEYASPEQAAGGAVGTATDIYSLGVVLFELVAGSRPRFPQEKASTAAARNGRSPRWVRRVRGDLDNILQMALRAEPERRYLSMELFGLDLRRFLDRLPIAARPETPLYRASLFYTRHRFATLLALALIAVGLTGAGLYIHETRLAARRFDDLHHFANSFLFDVDDKLRGLPNSTGARAVVAQKALGYLNALAAEKSGDRELQHEAGNAWRRVGEVQGDPGRSSLGDSAGARRSYEKSLMILEPLARAESGPRHRNDIRDDFVVTSLDLALLERVTANSARAEQVLLAALPFAVNIGSPPDPELQADYGEILVQYGWVLEGLGQTPEATRRAREAVAVLEAAARANPNHRAELADAVSVLAGRETRAGLFTEGLADYRRNLALREEIVAARPGDRTSRRNLMLGWAHIGDTLSNPPERPLNPPEAVSAYDHVLAIAREMAASDRTDRTARLDLAIGIEHAADALATDRQEKTSLPLYRESMAMLKELEGIDPRNRRTKEYIAEADGQMGIAYLRLNMHADGEAALARAIALIATVVANDTGDAIYRFRALGWMEALGACYAARGDRASTLAVVEQIRTNAIEAERIATTPRTHAAVAIAWERAGNMFDRLHDPAIAKIWYEHSRDAWAAVPDVPPELAAEPGIVRDRLARYR